MLLLTGFETLISGVGSGSSSNWTLTSPARAGHSLHIKFWLDGFQVVQSVGHAIKPQKEERWDKNILYSKTGVVKCIFFDSSYKGKLSLKYWFIWVVYFDALSKM